MKIVVVLIFVSAYTYPNIIAENNIIIAALLKLLLGSPVVTRNSINNSTKFAKIISVRSNHQRCSVKKLFLKISQYSPENTYVGDPF